MYFNDIFQESRKQSYFTQSKPNQHNNNAEENIESIASVVRLVLAYTVFGEAECKRILL